MYSIEPPPLLKDCAYWISGHLGSTHKLPASQLLQIYSFLIDTANLGIFAVKTLSWFVEPRRLKHEIYLMFVDQSGYFAHSAISASASWQTHISCSVQ